MTVDEENECPFCGYNLVYEPTVQEEKEHIVFNRYYLIYILKHIWFSLLCILIAAIKIIWMKPPVNYLFWLSVIFLLVSLSTSLFERKIAGKLKQIFSEDYVPFEIGFEKYILGAVGLILILFI